MSFPNEADPAPEPTPGAEPGTPEPTPDTAWMDSLDDATKARIQAHTEEQAAARARAAAEQAAAETEQRFRKSNGKWGNTANQLAQLGAVVDEHGNVAFADPNRLAAHLGIQPGIPAPAPTAPETDEEIDYLADDPATIRRKQERQLAKLLDEKLAPVIERNRQLEAALTQQAITPALTGAKDALAKFGINGAVTETPEYRQAYEQVLSTIPMNQRNPRMLNGAAFTALAMAQDAAEQNGSSLVNAAPPSAPPAPRPGAPVPARPGVGTAAPSRGAAPPAPPAADDGLTESDRQIMAALGETDPARYRLLTGKTGSNALPGAQYWDHLQQQKAARRGGR